MPYLDMIYRVALRECKDVLLAEDLVQETYKEAWRSYETYQPKTNSKAWLFKILFRIVGKWRLKQKRFIFLDLETLSHRKISLDSDAEQRVKNRELLGLLESLPKKYGQILQLADIEEFTYREISGLLEIPIGTVMSRLKRARSLFRKKSEAREMKRRSA